MKTSIKDASKVSLDGETKGVKTLLGDPKKAIIKLVGPLLVALLVQTLYYLFDAIWVSGLGADALAAIGFVFPFFIMATALSSGLSIGGVSGISRRIGANDKEGANNVAVHTFITMILVATIFAVPFFIFAHDLFVLIGAGRTAYMASSYARILAAGSIILFFSFISGAILRSEGDTKRPMYAMIIGASLNIILDPIFIYTFNLGVAGAAWATILSMSVASVLLFNWIFIQKNTYLSFTFRGFHFDKKIMKDIFRVGMPASLQQLSLSVMMLMINFIIISFADSDGVAVFSTGWRVVTIAILPLYAMNLATVPVVGVAFGSNAFDKLNTAYLYAIKIGFLIECAIALFIFIFAPWIAAVFTQTEAAARIAPDLETFFRIICIFFPGVVFGMTSSAVFQGIGKGIYAFSVTFFRTILLTPILIILFALIFDMGLQGMWWGLVIGNLAASAIAFTWGKLYINKLRAKVVPNI
ncbi:MAG: MATE family efflux transporter [Thermoplasmatales archaeon]|nr:MAG: MATE family efflux transporter [Thermoplasmatales archaeon]